MLSNSFTASVNLSTSPSSIEAARSCHVNFSQPSHPRKQISTLVSQHLGLTEPSLGFILDNWRSIIEMWCSVKKTVKFKLAMYSFWELVRKTIWHRKRLAPSLAKGLKYNVTMFQNHHKNHVCSTPKVKCSHNNSYWNSIIHL
jgi:hypothetical protein